MTENRGDTSGDAAAKPQGDEDDISFITTSAIDSSDNFSASWSSWSLQALRAAWRGVTSLCGARRVPLSGFEDTVFSGPPPLPPRRGVTAASDSQEKGPETVQTDPTASAAPGNCQPSSSQQLPFEQLLEEVDAALIAAIRGAEARAMRLRQQLRDPSEAASWRQWGEALRGMPDDIQPEAGRVQCSVVLGDGSRQDVVVKLPKPSKSLQDNALACFASAEKIDRTNERCEPLAIDAEAEAKRWRDAVAMVQQCREKELGEAEPDAFSTPDDVRVLYEKLGEAGFIRRPSKEAADSAAAHANAEARQRRKYGKEVDCFISPSGHEIVQGRTAAANEKVSFELTPRDAFWFHSDCGVAGSHVAILCPASAVTALEDIEFAASIAAWHSKARGQSSAAVCYCYGGQLSRPRVPKLGQVRILGRRGQIFVEPRPPCNAGPLNVNT